MSELDLIVIGGGPAGYTAAIRAAQLGKKTALIEQNEIGGTCLNRGCIPTKALLRTSELYAACGTMSELGINVTGASVDMPRVNAHKAEVVAKLRDGVTGLLSANKIKVIHGTAVITAQGCVEVKTDEAADTADSGLQTLTADRILIAAGSVPSRPPIPGLTLPGVVTSDEILEGPPFSCSSLVIIGGGVIGVEMASVYAGFGCHVTIIEALDRIIANLDKEFGRSLTMLLKKRGVEVNTACRVARIEKGDAGLICTFTRKDKEEQVTAEKILVCIGRRPDTGALFGPDVKPDMERGFLKVNPRFETSVPGICAVGDCIGGIMLAHKAEAEGHAAVDLMFGVEPSVDLSLVPSCIYTDPEIASVGISADEAKEQGIDVISAKYLMTGNAKNVIDGEERGYMKAVFAADTEKLLGVQMMCGRATDLIGEFPAIIANGMTKAQLLRGMRPHPTYAEGFTDVLEAVDGESILSAPARK